MHCGVALQYILRYCPRVNKTGYSQVDDNNPKMMGSSGPTTLAVNAMIAFPPSTKLSLADASNAFKRRCRLVVYCTLLVALVVSAANSRTNIQSLVGCWLFLLLFYTFPHFVQFISRCDDRCNGASLGYDQQSARGRFCCSSIPRSNNVYICS